MVITVAVPKMSVTQNVLMRSILMFVGKTINLLAKKLRNRMVSFSNIL